MSAFLTAVIAATEQPGGLPFGFATRHVKRTVFLSRTGAFLRDETHKAGKAKVVGPYYVRGSGTDANTAVPETAEYLTEPTKRAAVLEALRTLALAGNVGAAAMHTWLSTAPVIEGVAPLEWVHVEVEGAPDWWRTPDVVRRHQTRMAENCASDVEAPCSLCGTTGVLARLHVVPASLKAGLITFNAKAWTGYGRKQGLVAPTCVNCALRLSEGVDVIVGDRGTFGRLSYDRGVECNVLCWATGAKPWALFLAAIEGDADALTALIACPTVRVAIVGKNMQRVPLRGYAVVSGASIAARVQAWRAAGAPKPAAAIHQMGRDAMSGRDLTTANEALHRWFLFGEPLKARHMAWLRRRARWGNFAYKIRAAIGAEETPMSDHVPRLDPEDTLTDLERAAFLVGRAFRLAESVQIAKSRPQRTIYEAHGPGAARNLTVAHRVINRYALKNKLPNALLAEAQDLCTGRWPLRVPPRASEQFHRGYRVQAWHIRAARETANKTATDAATAEAARLENENNQQEGAK